MGRVRKAGLQRAIRDVDALDRGLLPALVHPRQQGQLRHQGLVPHIILLSLPTSCLTHFFPPDTLDKSKVTGVKQVDKLQDGVNNLVSGQFGQDGLLQPVGDAVSKEGVNRAERQGKDDSGSYAPGPAGSVVNPIADGGKKVGGGLVDGGKAAGGYVGGLFGGGKK